jgi:hypothetical protein
MALLVSSAERKLMIMKVVRCPSNRRSTGLIHRARMIDLVTRSLGTFSTTHAYSLSLISDIAPKPCMNSMRFPSFLIHSTDLGEFMSNSMSPLARIFALMNCMVSGMLSWLDFIAVRARLALATMICGSWLSRPCEGMPRALVNMICFCRSSFLVMILLCSSGI